ncbi:MAG: hypothetical protein HQK53_00585 [Oligoflexia bacterium]|nr:hypothetical protein [Oligoflexia bacterium]
MKIMKLMKLERIAMAFFCGVSLSTITIKTEAAAQRLHNKTPQRLVLPAVNSTVSAATVKDLELISDILRRPPLNKAMIEQLLEHGDVEVDKLVALHVLTNPDSYNHPQWVETLLRRNSPEIDYTLAWLVLTNPQWQKWPQWIDVLLERRNPATDYALAWWTLSQVHWAEHPEWVEILVRRQSDQLDVVIERMLLPQPFWEKNSYLQVLAGKQLHEYTPITVIDLRAGITRVDNKLRLFMDDKRRLGNTAARKKMMYDPDASIIFSKAAAYSARSSDRKRTPVLSEVDTFDF